MDLFVNALLITLGVFAAIAFVSMTRNAIMMGLAIRSLNREKKETREWLAKRAEKRARTKDHFHILAMEVVKNPEIVDALRAVPYSYKQTKAAKKQNYERNKIQAKLRKIVADINVRNAIYEMSGHQQNKAS